MLEYGVWIGLAMGAVFGWLTGWCHRGDVERSRR